MTRGTSEPMNRTNSSTRAGPPLERDVPGLLDGSRFLPLEISILTLEESGILDRPSRLRPDFALIAGWEGREHTFIAEYKRSSTPRALEAAIQQARRYAEVGPYLPMVIVPYLSPGALDRLVEEEVSGIDLSGNGLIIVPGEWFIRSTGAKNRFSAGAPIKNVYRGTTSLVARAFFARPTYPSVQEVLEEIQRRRGETTLPTVSKALKSLEEDLLVARGETIRLLQPERLLELLVQNYREPAVTNRRRVKVPDRWSTLQQFVSNAREYGVSLVGDLPSRYVIMPESDGVTRVYTTSIETTTRDVELGGASRFPNMELIETRDQTVYFDPSTDQQFPYISPLQTYLTLATGGKREQEAAAQLRPDLIQAATDPPQTTR